jgi:hypothetical protein
MIEQMPQKAKAARAGKGFRLFLAGRVFYDACAPEKATRSTKQARILTFYF